MRPYECREESDVAKKRMTPEGDLAAALWEIAGQLAEGLLRIGIAHELEVDALLAG